MGQLKDNGGTPLRSCQTNSWATVTTHLHKTAISAAHGGRMDSRDIGELGFFIVIFMFIYLLTVS